MIQELDIDFVRNEIKSAKKKGKPCKIKVMQWERIEGKRFPTVYLQTKNIDEIMATLQAEGYSPVLEKTNSQIAINYDLSGEVKSFKKRDLKTTILTVK